jgi:hypothetical protein
MLEEVVGSSKSELGWDPPSPSIAYNVASSEAKMT